MFSQRSVEVPAPGDHAKALFAARSLDQSLWHAATMRFIIIKVELGDADFYLLAFLIVKLL